MNLRKFLGFKLKVGDKVKGYSDYGVQYEGTVIQVENSKEIPGGIRKREVYYFNFMERDY